MVEELAIGTFSACFAVVCVAVAPERPSPVASPFEFYRAVDRVCAQVEKDSSDEIQRYWPDPKGEVAIEMRKWEHLVAAKVDGARKVLKGATGVRTMPGNAASAREEFLVAVRRYVEAGERFQGEGARSAALMGAADAAMNVASELAVLHGARDCESVV